MNDHATQIERANPGGEAEAAASRDGGAGDGEPVARLRGVGKAFYENRARGGTLKDSFLGMLSGGEDRARLQALRGIDLDLRRGEALGIVGANGSGKSTLLRIIAGIAEPSEGTVQTRGRIVAMIELTAGFHPDLTGEENARLQGTIYGLAAAQIEARLSPIFDYAELQDFRSTRLARYSSGMVARLGFAIAIHCEPEILILDEALSVGDQSFQRRCLAKIEELRRGGTAIVFVTHQMEFAERICQRLIWLRRGEICRQGPAPEVLRAYQSEIIADQFGGAERKDLAEDRIMEGMPGRFGSGEARIVEARAVDAAGAPRLAFRPGEPFAIEVEFAAGEGVQELDCSVTIDFEDGTSVAHLRAEEDGAAQAREARFPQGRGRFRLAFPAPALLPGGYTFSPAISRPGGKGEHYDLMFRLHHFSIVAEGEERPSAPVELRPTVGRL